MRRTRMSVTGMGRRGFLGALFGAAALDPERLLWVPRQKLISIPAPQLYKGWASVSLRGLDTGDKFTIARVWAINPVNGEICLRNFTVTAVISASA
jgi:hypothetical protein